MVWEWEWSRMMGERGSGQLEGVSASTLCRKTEKVGVWDGGQKRKKQEERKKECTEITVSNGSF